MAEKMRLDFRGIGRKLLQIESPDEALEWEWAGHIQEQNKGKHGREQDQGGGKQRVSLLREIGTTSHRTLYSGQISWILF